MKKLLEKTPKSYQKIIDFSVLAFLFAVTFFAFVKAVTVL
jgi:hypothetical protein